MMIKLMAVRRFFSNQPHHHRPSLYSFLKSQQLASTSRSNTDQQHIEWAFAKALEFNLSKLNALLNFIQKEGKASMVKKQTWI